MALSDVLTGYGGQKFPLPSIAGKYKRGLVVCGDAACVWKDLEAFGCASRVGRGSVQKEGWDFLTVNRLVETFPGVVEHAYSNNAEHLKRFIAARRDEYKREDFEGPRNTHSCSKGVMWRWPWSGHGTSLLGAVLVGVGLGYDAVVICGGPLDDGPHNGEPHWRKCRFTQSEAPPQVDSEVNSHWQKAIRLAFDGKVRSMSGRTREWLGAPECS